jgi:hypothetical protein
MNGLARKAVSPDDGPQVVRELADLIVVVGP